MTRFKTLIIRGFTAAVLLASISYTVTSFANDGGTIGNGGDAFTSHQETRFLDAMEFQDEFLPSGQIAYTEVIAPRLAEFGSKLPKTATYLRNIFVRGSNPRWYFSRYTLRELPKSSTTTLILTDYHHQQIGVNTGREVFIQKHLYDSLPNHEERAFLLTHEMLWSAVKTTKDSLVIRALTGRILSRFTYRLDRNDLGQELKAIINDPSSPLFQIVNEDLATVVPLPPNPEESRKFIDMCVNSLPGQKTVLVMAQIANYRDAVTLTQPVCQRTYEYFENRVHLDLEGKGLDDISALQFFPRVESLNLQNNELKNISALAVLPRLKTLNVGLNRFTQIPDLSGFVALRKLDLSRNRINNLAGLKSERLEFIDLSYNHIFDGLEMIGAVPHLFELDLSYNQLETLKGLTFANIPNLKRLAVRENRLVDINNLVTAASLVELDLSHNQLSTTAGLEAIQSIETLNLESNLLHAVTVDELPRKMKSLNLSGNEVERIYGNTTHNVGLKELKLKGANLASFMSLNTPMFTDLETLDFSGSKLVSVAGLRALSKLVQLDLDGDIPLYQGLPQGVDGQNMAGHRLFDIGYLYDLKRLAIPNLRATASLEHCSPSVRICPLMYLVKPHKNSHQEMIQLEIVRVVQ